MATLIRSAKSGSNWILNDLESYHIILDQVSPLLFFNLQELPQPLVDKELLINIDADSMQEDCHTELVTLLDLAMISDKGETAVNDFTITLFQTLGYTVVRTQVDLPLLICGKERHVKTNICIVNHSQNDIIFLIQEDKKWSLREPINMRAQLVAEAIAAFNENNVNRETIGLPPLAEKISHSIIPGIVMPSTSPILFQIPVTQTLLTHICHRAYSPDNTESGPMKHQLLLWYNTDQKRWAQWETGLREEEMSQAHKSTQLK
ncbi:hypothetical protein AN958_08609 [Leucoagaricus sp. SymC.cos]|nr:hypothetical protein AN958_08609 [Leucoagaricus sp. SymC.cos]